VDKHDQEIAENDNNLIYTLHSHNFTSRKVMKISDWFQLRLDEDGSSREKKNGLRVTKIWNIITD